MSATEAKPACDCVNCRIQAAVDAVAGNPVDEVLQALTRQIIRVAILSSSTIADAQSIAKTVANSLTISTTINAIAAFGVREATAKSSDDRIGPTKGTA